MPNDRKATGVCQICKAGKPKPAWAKHKRKVRLDERRSDQVIGESCERQMLVNNARGEYQIPADLCQSTR